jgi:UDP-N-acetylmuramate: L-alanyl-gamma-D-glutamyl-meso-diaminopimelate ligase
MIRELIPSREFDQSSLERICRVAGLEPGSHIHISGVCGTGTASVLTLLKQLGFFVTGSDKAFYPPMGDVVRTEADRVYEGYRSDNLEPRPDLVVIGNSLSRNNPEVEYVLEQDIPFASMPEVFAALLIGRREDCPTSIVVSGTHGKTTTTAAMATVLDNAGLKPGYFIGGIPKNLPGSIRPVDMTIPAHSRCVVLEGDEYDSAFFSKYSKFHSYRPDIALITSLEFDHADIYNSVEEIQAEFSKFVARVPAAGFVIVNDSGEYLRPLAECWRSDPAIKAPVLFYGEHVDSDFRLLSRRSLHHEEPFLQQLEFNLQGRNLSCKTQLSGPQNALNLLAVAAIAHLFGLAPEQISQGISAFAGVLRRQNVLGEVRGRLLIEDFAHHPTAVQLTLQGLKEAYPGRRIIAVFEPRSNTSRRAFFQEQYGRSFEAADVILIRQVQDASGYSNTAAPIVALDVNKLVSELRAVGKNAETVDTVDSIIERLQQLSAEGDVIVLMSNGDFGGLPQKLPLSL